MELRTGLEEDLGLYQKGNEDLPVMTNFQLSFRLQSEKLSNNDDR